MDNQPNQPETTNLYQSPMQNTPVEQQPISTPPDAVPPKKSILKLPQINLPFGKVNKKEVYILSFIFVIIVMLAILAAVFKIKIPLPGIILPSPTPTLAPTVAPTPVPRYLNDPDMLKLQQDADTLESELNGVDIEESNIQPRPLDWDINFKK